MSRLFNKCSHIFSMYSRLTEFRKSEAYAETLDSKTDLAIINILYNIANNRKVLVDSICNGNNIYIEMDDYFENGNIEYFLKKYELRLLQLIYKSSDLDSNKIYEHIKKEKQSLKEIVQILHSIDIQLPNSWDVFFSNIKKKKLLSLG